MRNTGSANWRDWGNTPTILVLNKTMEWPAEVDLIGLRAKFPFVQGVVKTDCVDGTGIAELRDQIRETVLTRLLRGVALPASWNAIKQWLESSDKGFLSYDEFRRGLRSSSAKTTRTANSGWPICCINWGWCSTMRMTRDCGTSTSSTRIG